MLLANRHVMKQIKTTRRAFLTIRVLGLIFLICGVTSFVAGHTNLAGFIYSVVLGIVCNVLPFLPRLMLRRKFRNMPNRDKLVTWEVTSDHLTAKTDLSTTDMLWDALVKVVRLRDGFLVSGNPGIFQWLPNHGFQDPADVERFAELAKSKVRQYNHAA